MQAMMLLHLLCLSDGIFESVKPHRTFSYCKGRIYNQDPYELSDDMLQLSPDNVQRVAKIKGNDNMIMLTFYGSFLPDCVKIGSLSLPVKAFIDRPLQCYRCYKFGHGRNNCTSRPQCSQCSALDSHPTLECE